MAGFNALIAKIERLQRGEVYQRIGTSIANAAHAECTAGFRGQRDPYGASWASRKDKRESWPILDKTGAGVDSLTARYVNGVVVMRIKGYFKFHQNGTASMPARRVFPEETRGLGTWSGPIQYAATNAVRELMK